MATETSDRAAVKADGRQRAVRTALAAAIIAAIAAVTVVVSRGTAAPSSSYSTAPAAWSLPALTGGGTVRLSDFRGKPLVLDFFASWCTACRSELPEFLAADKRMAGRVQFAAVDSEENGDGLALARQSGITAWRLARDVGGGQESGLREALESIPGMPITAFYDSTGRVLQVRLGALNADALSGVIAQLYPGTSP